MKQPASFRTGDPLYLVVASTSGSASPTVLTMSKAFTGDAAFDLFMVQTSASVRGRGDLPSTSVKPSSAARRAATRRLPCGA